MDEDAAKPTPAPAPRLCSTIACGGGDKPHKTKGRGFLDNAAPRDSRLAGTGRAADFDSLGSDGSDIGLTTTIIHLTKNLKCFWNPFLEAQLVDDTIANCHIRIDPFLPHACK
uniref:Uncharacterized protein n=1 Tax=Oryza meridionalis TaxID=40149 RepID=A0A0E0BX81_9ORYZ